MLLWFVSRSFPIVLTGYSANSFVLKKKKSGVIFLSSLFHSHCFLLRLYKYSRKKTSKHKHHKTLIQCTFSMVTLFVKLLLVLCLECLPLLLAISVTLRNSWLFVRFQGKFYLFCVILRKFININFLISICKYFVYILIRVLLLVLFV